MWPLAAAAPQKADYLLRYSKFLQRAKALNRYRDSARGEAGNQWIEQ